MAGNDHLLNSALEFSAYDSNLRDEIIKINIEKTVNWLRKYENALKDERQKIRRVLKEHKMSRGGGDKPIKLRICIPIIPTFAGIFPGHHSTYRMAGKFINDISKWFGSNCRINVLAIFLDHSSSVFMAHRPISANGGGLESGYTEHMKLNRTSQSKNPAYKEKHAKAFKDLIEKEITEPSVNITYNHKFESALFRDMLFSENKSEILRQAPRVLESVPRETHERSYVSFDKARGVELKHESLCTVVLRAADVMGGVGNMSMIICGGDMFDQIVDIRKMYGRYFGGVPFEEIDNLCILTNIMSEAVHISSMESPGFSEEGKKIPSEVLLRAGLELKGESDIDEIIPKYKRELELIIGPDDIQVEIETVGVQRLKVCPDTFCSRLTKGAKEVIRQLYLHGEKGSLTRSEIHGHLIKAGVQLSLRGVNKILINLKNFDIVEVDSSSRNGFHLYKLTAKSFIISLEEVFKGENSTSR
jgi:hypothetical protein